LLIALAIALAVPIQGLAAVTAGLCVAMGHHEAGTSATHDHAAHHAHPEDASVAHAQSDGDTSSDAHCAPCVACCAAAAISASVQVFLPEPPAAAVLAPLPVSPSGFVPDKLDRPPLPL
jgi:hypothetical protein